MKGLFQSDNQWEPNFRTPKMAPAFRGEAPCGLALSSLAPWEVVQNESGRITYTCKACVGMWKPGLGGSRQITLFGKVDPSTLVRDLKGMPAASSPAPIVDGPSGLPFHQTLRSLVLTRPTSSSSWMTVPRPLQSSLRWMSHLASL